MKLELVLADVLARNAGRRGALLPILHELQHVLGYVPSEAVSLIAGALNLSRAEVHGAISFYHDFRTSPPAKPVIKLCRAEACQARGAEQIAAIFENDGRIEHEVVYCLGLCASGPSAMVGERLFAQLDEVKARKLIDQVLAG